MKYSLTCTVFVYLLVSCGPLFADEVTTVDGSRLKGTIRQIAEGRLVLLTDFAGRVEIDTAKVTAIATDRTVHVELTSGETLRGAIARHADGTLTVRRPAGGDIGFAMADVSQLWAVDAERPSAIAAREKAEAERKAAEPVWAVSVEGGLTRKEGNTDTLSGHGRFDARRTAGTDLLHLYVAGKYDEQDDIRTTNEYLSGARFERRLDARRFQYARGELEFDEFEDIDLRATAAAGSGRYWVKRPDREIKTIVGLGYRREMYDDDRTEDDVVLDLGLDYRTDISPGAQFTHSASFSPDLGDFDNYRFTLDTALRLPFKNDRLAWKIGVRNEYNSRPQPGLERLDNTYYTSIVLALK